LKVLASWRWRMMKSGWLWHGLQEPQGEQATETFFNQLLFSYPCRMVLWCICVILPECFPIINNRREVLTKMGAMHHMRSLNFVHYYIFKIYTPFKIIYKLTNFCVTPKQLVMWWWRQWPNWELVLKVTV
jgi:hypothetical protein